MPKKQDEDVWGQSAGAIGALVIVLGILMVIKDKLGLGWPATVLLVAGALVALGYAAWWLKTRVPRWWAHTPAEAEPVTLAQETLPEAADGGEAAPAVHTRLTDVLVRAQAIRPDQVILLDDVQEDIIQGIGVRYKFLLPEARTYGDVAGKLAGIASMLGVTRLHLKVEDSLLSEREVTLLKLNEPPFSRPFDPPTREQVRAYGGVPIGHDVTGALVGVESLDKASMLIAGMTQMGKTTLVNGLITCLLIAYGKFEAYLLDGKICGLTDFEPIATRYESSDDPAVLESILDELLPRVENRYALIQTAKRNREPAPRFDPVVLIIDEGADFYVDNGTPKSKELVRRVEDKSRKLVAKGLECGVSVILLTQRPDKDAIPVKVRSQFQYRICLYVDSTGSVEVALGNSYFESLAPINPVRLNPKIKGQGVLYANGRSTLLRGFNFEDKFMWDVVDEVAKQRESEQQQYFEEAQESPLTRAIELMESKGMNFISSVQLGEFLEIGEFHESVMGRKLSSLLGVSPEKVPGRGRGFELDRLKAAATADV
ncbi:FtsK/SpoIIIE domain-containing protein [Streptomyces xanthochromogenes]|uniref:FtsK/SpoIIIE domain-containing protein n=1 Tax=Streptomyces xanthochromogenes TaxID=67384 RepID=UPI00343AD65D